jgi:urease accessory protein
MTSGLDETGLLRLMQLTSPSLPIGAFAWSQGLESAVDQGWIRTEAQAAAWLDGVLRHGLAYLDIPVLRRLHEALTIERFELAASWNAWLLACRESRELWEEDTQIGAALGRLLVSLDAPVMQQWQTRHGQAPLSYAAAFALAAVHAGLTARTTAVGYLWAFSENQAAALIKLGVLGQTGAQRLLGRLHAVIGAGVEQAWSLPDDALGASLSGQALASAWHEHQHSRLFRS